LDFLRGFFAVFSVAAEGQGRMRDGGYGRGGSEEEHEPKPGCAEGAGQAAANCAAVCCCCPLALLDVLLLVTVKLPAGVMRRVRRRRKKAGEPSGSSKPMIAAAAPAPEFEEEAAAELEREIMNSRLYGAGFWRSVSSGSSSCASSVHRR
jgi:hypothetical protein